MKKMISLMLGLFFLSLSVNTFAIDIPTNVSTISTSDSSISLEWDDVTGAIGYYIYYGTKSGSGSSYEVEGIDLIDSSEYVIEKLEAQTKYFIAFTAVDTLGNESNYSKELEETTLKKGEISKITNFGIRNVEVIDATTLQFTFSADLDISDSSVRNFIIVNKKTKISIEVDISEVSAGNKKQVLLILGEPLAEGAQYDVTVLEIRDSQGNNIESGIEGFISFSTPKTFAKEPIVNPSIGPNTPEEDTDIPLRSAGEKDTTNQTIIGTTKLNEGNAGVTINQEDIDKNTVLAAENNNTLPQTGPEHWIFLFIAALLIGFILFSTHKKAIQTK